ncbi:hypothetical protein M885DRAFT_511937 [Pelagophyceae sp. CCMP2097]|nr:hypothetical protein M885DRAFT_511937 [Pelagophyceae sp. CCMP2097]
MLRCLVLSGLASGASAFQRPSAGLRSVALQSSITLPDIQTDSARERKSKAKEEEEDRVAAARVSPAEEESELLLQITGAPKIGVSGLFDNAQRTDQSVLDVLHAQECWGGYVVLAPDTGAAKKRLTSRSARYSGLLNKLEFVQWDVSAEAQALATVLDANGIQAWLAFDVAPEKVAMCLEAAKLASSVTRVAIASNGAVDSSVVGDASLQWSVVAVPGGVADAAPKEAGALSVDFVETGHATAVSREDVCLVVAEAFVVKSAQNKAFSLSYGGENATAYLKSLREAGYTRRAEVAKIVGGGLQTWLAVVEAAKAEPEKKKVDLSDAGETKIIKQDGSNPDFAEQLAANRAAARVLRDEKISKAARIQLKSEYGEKQFTTCRAVTEEEYVRYYWKRAVEQQAQYLGYKKSPDAYVDGPTVAFPEDDDMDDDDDQDAADAAAKQ